MKSSSQKTNFAWVLLLLVGCASNMTKNPENRKALLSYCTVSHFYFLGEINSAMAVRACPEPQWPELSQAYLDGEKLYALRNQRASLQKEIQAANADHSFVADIRRLTAVVNGISPTAQQEQELREVLVQIKDLEKKAPDSAEFCEVEMKQKAAIKKIVPVFIQTLSDEEARTQMDTCSRATSTVL